MKASAFLFGIFILPLLGFGQYTGLEVVSSAGGFFQESSVAISWTIGETVVDTWVNEDLGIILSSGFQQGDYKITGVPGEEVSPLSVSVFPNPATSFTYLRIWLPVQQRIQVVIMDISGRELVYEEYTAVENDFVVPLNISAFKSGLYLLRVSFEGNEVRVLKLIKL